MRNLFYVLIAIALGACGATPTGMPAPVVSEAEIEELEDAAAAFGDRHFGAWPDVETFVADFSEDVHFFDPTWGDQITGRETVYWLLRQWAKNTDYTIEYDGMYISTNSAAYEESWPAYNPRYRSRPTRHWRTGWRSTDSVTVMPWPKRCGTK